MKAKLYAGAVLTAVACAVALAVPALGHAAGYVTKTTTGNPLLAASTDTGNHCNDCTTTVALPFPVQIYGVAYTSASVSSNGNVQFGSASTPNYAGHGCLPISSLGGPTVLAFQDDLDTTVAGYGINEQTNGSAPGREFVLRWHAQYAAGIADFEVVFRENSARISVIYGATADNGSGESSGVQASGTGPSTQFSCTTATLTNGLRVDYVPTHPFTRTGSASNFTPFGARISGEVNPDGSATKYSFQWGPTVAYGHSTAATSAGGGNGNVPVHADLSGLAPNTVYHYRLIATNASGTSVGADQTFTTFDNHGYAITRSTGVPLISGTAQLLTLFPSDDIIVPVTLPFPVDFYGTPYTTVYADTNGVVQFTGNQMSDNVPTCLPHTGNFVGGGLFAYHADLLLGLDASDGLYSATTGVAPNRQFVLEWRGGYFLLAGVGGGLADFDVVFYENNPNRMTVIYGPHTDIGGTETAGVQEGVIGPFTQYSCKDAARPLTEGLRLDYNFTLERAPSVTAQAATGVGGSTATLHGTVNPNGYGTTARFQYGPTSAYGSSTPVQALAPNTSPSALSATLGGLVPGKTYHYRLVATSPNGTGASTDQTFTTSPNCVVPKVVGLGLGAAKKKIVAGHCKVGKVTKKVSTQKAKGKVLAQSPKPGTTLGNGAKVNLTVGKGPKKKKR